MAKDKAATALATDPSAAPLAAAPANEADQLSAMLGELNVEDDGLGEVDKDDLRLPIIVWNMKGKDPKTGELRRIDEFYDTLNETSHRTIRCAFIHLHKTNLFSRFNNDSNENVIYCSSQDRVVGRLREKHPDLGLARGTERACETCPDKNWQQVNGKNVRNCDNVYGVFAVHLDDQLRPTEGFLIRYKRTALQPFKTYMQKHHIGRRPLPNGQRGNVPLYVYEATIKLEVSKNGNYATPVITRGALLPKETIATLAQQSKFFAEIGNEATAAAEKQEQKYEAAEPSNGGAGISNNDFV